LDLVILLRNDCSDKTLVNRLCEQQVLQQ